MSILSKLILEIEKRESRENRWLLFKLIKWLIQSIMEIGKESENQRKLDKELDAKIDGFVDTFKMTFNVSDELILRKQLRENIKKIFEENV